MSAFGVLGMDADAGGSMLPAPQPVEVGALPSFPVDPVASYVAPPVSPYPTVVDPFKRRTALREYFRGLRGENKENERGNEGDGKSPSTSLPKQKTLGLCRRHVVPTAIAVSGEGMLRDKRKFNAPRQTPEKRQRPAESDLGAELPRRLDVVYQMVAEDESEADGSQLLPQFGSREHVELEGQVPVRDEAGIRRLNSVYARAKDVTSSINRQAQESQSLSFKPQTPTMRKPLTPVNINRQASQVHTPPMPLKPNFSGGVEHEDNGSSESLFQLASGKRYQPSAAAKARAASLFE